MWKIDEGKINQRYETVHKTSMSYIETVHGIYRSALVEETVVDTTTTKASTTNNVVPTPSPLKPKQRETKFILNPFRSNGKEFCYDISYDHDIVQRDHLKCLQNDSRHLWRIHAKLQAPNYSTHDAFTQSLWGIRRVCAPVLALSTTQYLIPLIIMAFYYNVSLFKYKNVIEMDELPMTCPSD